MTTRIHHLNFLVRDLEAAVARYEAVLDIRFDPAEEMTGRAVRLARVRLGGTWLVLVQPTGPGAPARQLEAKGEGVMLVSFGVRDLDEALERAEATGVEAVGPERRGLDGWRVADLDPDALNSVPVQFTES